MTSEEFRAFHKDFAALQKKHPLTTFHMIILLEDAKSTSSAVLAHVEAADSPRLMNARVQAMVRAVLGSLVSVAGGYYSFRGEALLGMLTGTLNDMWNQIETDRVETEDDDAEKPPEEDDFN